MPPARSRSSWAVAIVAKPPSTTTTPTPTPTPAGPPILITDPASRVFGARTLVTLRLASKRVRPKGPLRVRVANGNPFAVAARLAGRTVERAGRRTALPARRVIVPARGARTVALKLPKALRTALRRHGRVAIRLTAAVTDHAGNRRTVTKRATVKRR